jgi:hypothetical protein
MAWSFVHGAAQHWLHLPAGVHEFKLVLHGDKWCYDVDLPTVLGGAGMRNNVVEVKPRCGAAGVLVV